MPLNSHRQLDLLRHPWARALMLSLICMALAGSLSHADEKATINLADAYSLAIDSMPTIEERRALLDASYAQLQQARGQRLPTLTADANYTASEYETARAGVDPATRQRVSQIVTTDEDSYRYGINLTQPVYDRSVSTGVTEALNRQAVAEADLEASQDTLAGQVAETYFKILRAQKAVQLATAETQAYELQVNQMERRLTRGLASRVDVLDARMRFDEGRSAIARGENDLELARLDLQRITGKRVNRIKAAEPESVVLQAPPNREAVETFQRMAESNSPSVLPARAEVDLARSVTSRRQAQHFPVLSVQARYSDTNATDQLVQGEDRRVFLALEVPLYQGGQTAAGVDEARARERAAQARLTERQRQVTIETRQLVNNLRAAYREVASSKQALDTARAQVEATERGLDLGIRDLVEVLDSRARLYSIRRDLVKATYDYLIAQVRLETVTGDFDDDRLRDFDSRYLTSSVDLTRGKTISD